MIPYIQLSKLSFFCLCETEEARKRPEVCTQSHLKIFLNSSERKRSSRSHRKGKKRETGLQKKKLFSLIVADPVYGHIRTKGIKKAAPKEVL